MLCVLLVITLIFVLGRNKQQVPPQVPPWMYPPPRPQRRRKKATTKKNKESENKKETTPETQPAKEVPVVEAIQKDAGIVDSKPETEKEKETVSLNDDPNVLKSEIDDIRKSVVSMSVGQPGRTSTIVKEWLEQPAPEAPEAPEEPSDDGGDDEGDDE